MTIVFVSRQRKRKDLRSEERHCKGALRARKRTLCVARHRLAPRGTKRTHAADDASTHKTRSCVQVSACISHAALQGDTVARGAAGGTGRRTDAHLVFGERARELYEDTVGRWHKRPRFGDG